MKRGVISVSVLEEICPNRVRYGIRGMFDESYDLVNKLYTDNKWLTRTNICKKDIKSDVLRGAIADIAKLFCEKGIIPYTFLEQPNTIHNCAHVELKGKSSVILPCRVENSSAMPTYSIFRNNYIENYNMDSLFPELQKQSKIKYLAATYGDNGVPNFQFGRVGIPGKKKWLDWLTLVQGPYKKFVTKHEEKELLVGIKEKSQEALDDE
jgi:hypothetical protein